MKKLIVEMMFKDMLVYMIISISIIFFTRKRKDTFKNFIIGMSKNIKLFFIILLSVIICNALITYGVNFIFPHSQKHQILLLIKSASRNLVMLYLVFVLPLFEELIFRKVLFYSIDQKVGIFRYLKGNTTWIAYIVSVLGFALVHVIHPVVHGDYFNACLMSIPYCVIGTGCSFVYKKTGSVYSSIAIHVINNLVGFIVI